MLIGSVFRLVKCVDTSLPAFFRALYEVAIVLRTITSIIMDRDDVSIGAV